MAQKQTVSRRFRALKALAWPDGTIKPLGWEGELDIPENDLAALIAAGVIEEIV